MAAVHSRAYRRNGRRGVRETWQVRSLTKWVEKDAEERRFSPKTLCLSNENKKYSDPDFPASNNFRRSGDTTLRDWREDGCLVLAVAEDGHLAILTDLQATPSFDANRAARVRAPSAAVRTRFVSKMQPIPLRCRSRQLRQHHRVQQHCTPAVERDCTVGGPRTSASTKPRLVRRFLACCG